MSNNKIEVSKISINKNYLEYTLDIKGEVKKYFNQNENMFIQYNHNIENIPEGIAVIPLLTNILPIAWFADAEVIVNTVDKTFFENIEKIKLGYANMHKKANLKGNINVKNIIDYKYTPENRSATFFSGGVDSLSTLITRLDEQPTLITVWGADIKTSNQDGWDKVEKEVVEFGKLRDLDNLLIKSNFREFLNERELNSSFWQIMNDNWWHGAQHGMGLIGLAAPYAYLNSLKMIYIPSTFTEKDGHVSCASYPTIDNNIKFSGCRVLHEGFQNTRQDKIHIISKYLKEKSDDFIIRVCWQSSHGGNCSICEKCSRTIMALIAEKVDPNSCGFNVNKHTLKKIYSNIKYEWIMPEYLILLWKDIQYKFNENKDTFCTNKSLNWIFSVDLEKANRKKLSLIYRVRRKIMKIIRG